MASMMLILVLLLVALFAMSHAVFDNMPQTPTSEFHPIHGNDGFSHYLRSDTPRVHSSMSRNSFVIDTQVEIFFSSGLTSEQADDLLQLHGRNELRENSKSRWKLLLEQFTAPMPIMIWVAIVVEAALENWLDLGILCGLQAINGFVGFYETNKADNAIAALKSSLKPEASVLRDGHWQRIDAGLVVPGDCVKLKAGGAVPADCYVNDGEVSIDQSSLTGEAMPVHMYKGSQAKMGSTVSRGEVDATVYATGMNTLYGKTAALLEIGEEGLGDLQKILLRVVVKLLVLSFVLCGTTLIYLLASKEKFKASLSFVVVLLIASIPVAMEVVVTATLALGSRELSSHHTIVAKLSAIERLAGMDVLCSDKTGTLTLNKMTIQDECPIFVEGVTKEDVIVCAALATKWKEPPSDALDTMVLGLEGVADRCEDSYTQTAYRPFDASLKRTEADIVLKSTGAAFTVMKGAVDTIVDLSANGNAIQDQVDAVVEDLARRGIRTLAIARSNSNGDLECIGLLTFLDPPRPDAGETIHKANELGVMVKMITGDHLLVAQETARVLSLGNNRIIECGGALPTIDIQACNGKLPETLYQDYGDLILATDGFAGALPEHKFVIIGALKQGTKIVGMTGDGVNDAPALKVSHCGIAVEGATDAARAAADIVLTRPGLNAIIEAIVISRRIFSRMNSFLIYRIAATIQLLVFFFIAVLAIHPDKFVDGYPQFWSMPVIALIVITVLNDGTIIAVAYDNVPTSPTPRVWNMGQLWSMAIALGSVACFSSLLCLYLALDSEAIGLQSLGLPKLDYGQVITTMYLKVSLSDFMTLFSARTGTDFFWSSRPSWVLMGAAAIAFVISTVFAVTWPFPKGDMDAGSSINAATAAYVWLYCIIFFVIQDSFKVGVFSLFERFEHRHVPVATQTVNPPLLTNAETSV